MQLINHHIHTIGSDGKLTPEEVVKLAIENKLSFICFTDHYTLPPEIREKKKGFASDEYLRDKFNDKKYLDQVKRVKGRYNGSNGKLDVSWGVEFDWYEKHKDWIREQIRKHEFDCTLVAMHLLSGEDNPYPMNWSDDLFKKAIRFYGGIENVVREYYDQVVKAVETGMFDIIAHFDLVKTYNKDSKYFDEKSEWYQEIVRETLDKIVGTGTVIEINTSGLRYPCNNFFPSTWILEEIKKREIPITIGSDFHEVKFMRGLDDAVKLAREVGFDYIVKFKNKEMIKVHI